MTTEVNPAIRKRTLDVLEVLCIFAVIPLILTWRGYVLTFLWVWFVVPIFALPTLGIPQAIGVSFVASYLTHQQQRRRDDDKKEDAWIMFGRAAAMPAMALLFGWLLQRWAM